MVYRLLYLISLVSLAVAVAPESRAQPNNVTLEQIVATWKARQEKVKSASFEFNRKETIFKGSFNWILASRNVPDPQPNPPKTYEVEGTGAFRFSETNSYYSYDMPRWSPKTKALYQTRYETVFDGKISKSLRTPASGDQPYPNGIVKKAARSEPSSLFLLSPITKTLRGHHEQYSNDLPAFEVTGRTVAINGRQCLELVSESRSNNRREVLHLDKARGYVMVRHATFVQERPTWKIDVTYSPDPLVGSIPQAWEYMIHDRKDQPPSESGRITVTKYHLNPDIPDGDFDLVYPPKTLVSDYSSGDMVYVIQEGGEKGKEVPANLTPSYEELLQPPETTVGASVRKTIITVSAVTIVVCLTGLLIRWGLRRKQA